MPDNLRYKQPPTGEGDSFSTDEITIDGVLTHVQRIKIVLGGDGVYQRDLQNGQTTMANSLPVVIASDQNVQLDHTLSRQYDVRATASVLNGLPIPGTDVQNYRWVSVNVITAGNEVIFEGSIDDTNWFPISLLRTNSTWQVTGTIEDGIYHGPINIKSFRVRIVAYTSGSVAAIARFSATPTSLHANYARTELGLPRELNETLPSGQEAGSVASLPYGYNRDTNLWNRLPIRSSAPQSNDPGILTRLIGGMPSALGRKATYYASIKGSGISPTAGADTSVAYLWHSSANTKKVSIQKMLVSFVSMGGSGDYTLSVTRITSENMSPGGTIVSSIQQDSVDPTSNTLFRAFGNTPERADRDAVSIALPGNHSGQIDLVDILEGKGFTCRGGVGEGWEVRARTETGMGIAPKIAATFVWIEE